MLEERRADAHRARPNLGFEEEDREPRAERDHADDEEDRDRRPEMAAHQAAGEKQDHDKANQDGGEDRKRYKPAPNGDNATMHGAIASGMHAAERLSVRSRRR